MTYAQAPYGLENVPVGVIVPYMPVGDPAAQLAELDRSFQNGRNALSSAVVVGTVEKMRRDTGLLIEQTEKAVEGWPRFDHTNHQPILLFGATNYQMESTFLLNLKKRLANLSNLQFSVSTTTKSKWTQSTQTSLTSLALLNKIKWMQSWSDRMSCCWPGTPISFVSI